MGDVGSGFSSAAGIFRSLCSPPPPPSAGDSDSSLPEFLFSLAPPPPADKPAFVDASSGRSLSFADLRRLSGAAASALSALGLRRGHLALLLSPNSLPFPALALSVLSLGALLSTPNPLLTPPSSTPSSSTPPPSSSSPHSTSPPSSVPCAPPSPSSSSSSPSSPPSD
ncbi:4-coumarate--CoA ligase-like 5 [Ananas comosus]|uniref:4-coumarate--CoA ligase-like 5 n=1 Tax=Ananas comosus TaxID=4615 RepID=A0A199URJ6_ANACO|nr:4-coumarate--CoA ligase-like 5 [Ananas comosus]